MFFRNSIFIVLLKYTQHIVSIVRCTPTNPVLSRGTHSCRTEKKICRKGKIEEFYVLVINESYAPIFSKLYKYDIC